MNVEKEDEEMKDPGVIGGLFNRLGNLFGGVNVVLVLAIIQVKVSPLP